MKQSELIEEYIKIFYMIKELFQTKVFDIKKHNKLEKQLNLLWPQLDNKSIDAVRKILTGRPGL